MNNSSRSGAGILARHECYVRPLPTFPELAGLEPENHKAISSRMKGQIDLYCVHSPTH